MDQGGVGGGVVCQEVGEYEEVHRLGNVVYRRTCQG